MKTMYLIPDNTWKTFKTSQNNTAYNKVSNKKLNSIDVSKKYQPISIHENEVTKPHINSRMNNDIDKYKNAFDSNIENNLTTRKKKTYTS